MDSFIDAVATTGLGPAVVDPAPAGGARDHSLHTDSEAICPRCLRWIGPEDYLRRNGIGLLQHETCPPLLEPPAPLLV
jgi:hypothetical protein